ncbi:MAG: hypothetical protein ABIE68_03895 [bacterium]
MDKLTIKIIKILIIVSPLILFGYLLDKRFVPSGKISFVYDFKNDSGFISKLYPDDRIAEIENTDDFYSQALKKDLAYFDTFIFRPFNEIKMTVDFKPGQQNVVELGPDISDNKWTYDFQPLTNQILNNLTWEQVAENGTILWQKEKNYDSLEQLFGNLPGENKNVAYYNYDDFISDRRLADYSPTDETYVINEALRGSHTIYTYIKDENLDIKVQKSDLNRYNGQDELNIRLFSGAREIFAKTIDDDGINDNSDVPGKIQATQVKISKESLPEGIYRIELDTSDDVLIRRIETKQNKLVFANKIFLAENVNYLPTESVKDEPTIVYASIYPELGKTEVETPRAESLQTITFDNKSIKLTEPNTKYDISQLVDATGITKISVPDRDIKIESKGFFAFSDQQYFYPLPPNYSRLSDTTNLDKTDYIIANYVKPTKLADDRWQNSITFNYDDVYIDQNNTLQFALSAPNLENNNNSVAISQIKLELIKDPLHWNDFLPRLKNYITNLYQ